ncbi:MAG TPA: pyridoxal-phosphate dependent enzyme, partial [bacterium]|nr:pyridoxal-phosphate dependent enzyme [bacterium]
TLFAEAEEQRLAARAPAFDAILLQAGVGGLAYAGVIHANRGSGVRPTLICVEPTDADCLLESILSKDGSIQQAKGKQNSIMAGLNCGTPSLLAWPAIRAGVDFFLAVDDSFAEEAMRRLARPKGGDPAVVSGESGAAGLAGLLALCKEPSLAAERAELAMGKHSNVLLISTEGDTDPANYARIVDRDLMK